MPDLGMPGEAGWRLGIFGIVLLSLVALEWRFPRRPAPERRQRWPRHLAISLIDTLLLRLLLPVAAFGLAIRATQEGWGLFNVITTPAWLAVLLSLLALDLAIYWQHRLLHAVPLLWRLHRMHHSDVALDATSALRFHPLEILLSMLIKMGLVLVLGAPALAVLIFEILLNATALFNHANLALPRWLDRGLRLLLVTPDMHRVHHSWHREETDSNFGFNLSWWDRLFGSYRAQPRDGHRQMTIGLTAYRSPAEQRLLALLKQPLD